MSDFTKVYEIDFPAGNGSPEYAQLDTPLGLADVQEILITFPPGCAGLVGIQIRAGGSPAFPNDDGSYFVFDDYTLVQSVANQIKTGQWTVAGYNSDYIDHVVQVIYMANNVVYGPSISSSQPVSL
jgi:hypothetical protein